MPEYRSIGKIVAAFGLEGEVILRHYLGKKTTLKGLEVVFMEEKKDEMIPYFVEATRARSQEELGLKLEGVLTKEAAQRLIKKEIWLTEEDFHRYAGSDAPISLLGFDLIDEGVNLGEILEVIEQPHQLLCRIDLEGKEVLIPIHEDLLKKVDKNKKQVHVILPDGLLEIYR